MRSLPPLQAAEISALPAADPDYDTSGNGEEAKITHELMGHVQDTEDGLLLQLPDEEQKKEFHSILEWADETKSFVVFGEEDQTYGRFETDIFVEIGRAHV